MTVDERIKIANNVLKIIDIKLKLTRVEDVDSKLFTIIYQNLFSGKLEGIIELPSSETDDVNNMNLILETLSKDVLHVSLSHISPEDVARGQQVAVVNLLEIFQGLAECAVKQGGKLAGRTAEEVTGCSKVRVQAVARLNRGGKSVRSTGDVTNEPGKLRNRIKRTDRQIEQLAGLTERTIAVSSVRQRYLQSKIEQLLGKSPYVGRGEPPHSKWDRTSREEALWRYVDKHDEQVAAVLDMRPEVARRRQGNRRILDDDLTVVTANETGAGDSAIDKNDSDDMSDDASNVTYVLDSTTGQGDTQHSQSEVDTDVRVKDAWAQVNKDMIRHGYEKEFLDMLLEEGETLDTRRKQCESKGEMLRNLSQHNITARSLSAFDELVAAEDISGVSTSIDSSGHSHGHGHERPHSGKHGSCSTRQHLATNNHRRPGTTPTLSNRATSANVRSGFMRPIVKQMGHGNSSVSTGIPIHTARDRHRQYQHGTQSNSSSRSDQAMITKMLDSFPGLQLNEHTVRHLWTQAAQQAASIQRAQQQFLSKLMPSEQRVEEARKRQELLTVLLRKEAMHQMRLTERQEERLAHITTYSTKERQRQQSARAKRYFDEFSNGMKARMMNKQAREEEVFRTMFKAALKIQRDRINEMRRYARDVKNENLSSHQKDLDSLENYYRDRFSMLADSLRTERKQIELQDKSQEIALLKLKKEMRAKMEHDIRMIQQSMVHSQHETYFRQLDANTVLSGMSRED